MWVCEENSSLLEACVVAGSQCKQEGTDVRVFTYLLPQLGAVYLFEYMARGAASKARPKVDTSY